MKRYLMLSLLALVAALPVNAQDESGRMNYFAFKQFTQTSRQPAYLEGEFQKRVRAIVQRKDELGVSEKQLNRIKTLRAEMESDIGEMAQKISEIDVNIRSLMLEESPDTAKISGLVDEKYEAKKEEARIVIRAIDGLRGILTAQQQKMMKERKDAGKNK